MAKVTLRRAAAAFLAAGTMALASLPAHAANTPSFEIISPQAGSTVSSPVELKVAVTGTKIGKPTSGYDHLHVKVDDGKPATVFNEEPVTLNLAPGKHTIGVELAEPTHQPIGSWKTVEFTVH
ncbi:MAG: hypothetical protein EPN72_01030 [Nevskiaceae bacterium]|nr:MAG: hypothetical protein EPN63_11780 [Nevskiaceae bacterium]TBR74640.1 MAG: hypothetical protein EPN72_01030 [Nevskiaceae bacterium]